MNNIKNTIENLAGKTATVVVFSNDNKIKNEYVGTIDRPETNEDFSISFVNEQGGRDCKAYSYSMVSAVNIIAENNVRIIINA